LLFVFLRIAQSILNVVPPLLFPFIFLSMLLIEVQLSFCILSFILFLLFSLLFLSEASAFTPISSFHSHVLTIQQLKIIFSSDQALRLVSQPPSSWLLLTLELCGWLLTSIFLAGSVLPRPSDELPMPACLPPTEASFFRLRVLLRHPSSSVQPTKLISVPFLTFPF
jgi:hypothetical protein